MNVTSFSGYEYWSENTSEIYLEDDVDSSSPWTTLWDNGKLEIPLYSVIFLLAVIGNILVILTLAKNSRMRTNTNVFLLNLAVSDLVLAVLCMPFTLVGTLLRDFIFGEWMCKLVPFLQATSVAASVYTLVALSIERYYAICHPLRSRRWQTLSHAYHLIGLIWTGSAASMLPIPLLSELQPTNKGHHKCRERWPSGDYERAYNLFLDVLLLVVPLLALAVTYYLIAVTLWRDLARRPAPAENRIRRDSSSSIHDMSHVRTERETTLSTNSDTYDESIMIRSISADTYRDVNRAKSVRESDCGQGNSRSNIRILSCLKLSGRKENCDSETGEISTVDGRFQSYNAQVPDIQTRENSCNDVNDMQKSWTKQWASNPTQEIGLRHTNYERSLTNKQRVIKMLFVVVLEFFICWTPLYVINTLALFWPQLIYETVGYKMISFCHLLAYTSGCCNPITYCFMNKNFRTSFINLFGCCESK